MSKKSQNHLIIGGTTKAGTTSLFNYLSGHPEICPASFKETRYFLDPEYPLPSPYRIGLDPFERYLELYMDCEDTSLKLEATPDYLYSDNCAQIIKKYLPNVKLIFILRDPIERLKSWFKFARQDGVLGKGIDFDEYVKIQYENIKNKVSVNKQYMQALMQGCYSRYLKDFYIYHGPSNIKIVFIEALAEDPVRIMQEICDFANISPSFYDEYDFKVSNKTSDMRAPLIHGAYKKIRFKLRFFTSRYPKIHKVFKVIREWIDPIYYKLNSKRSDEINLSSETLALLKDFYGSDKLILELLIGKKVLW